MVRRASSGGPTAARPDGQLVFAQAHGKSTNNERAPGVNIIATRGASLPLRANQVAHRWPLAKRLDLACSNAFSMRGDLNLCDSLRVFLSVLVINRIVFACAQCPLFDFAGLVSRLCSVFTQKGMNTSLPRQRLLSWKRFEGR